MRLWLRNLREKNHLSQQYVAAQMGITQQYYNFIETGKRQHTLDLNTVVKLSELFNVSVEWIVKAETKTA